MWEETLERFNGHAVEVINYSSCYKIVCRLQLIHSES